MFFGGSSVHRKDADADSGISLVFIVKAQKTLRLLARLIRLSNTNCIRLLNPSHMHTRSKPPPFFMTLLSNICSSLTHVSPPLLPSPAQRPLPAPSTITQCTAQRSLQTLSKYTLFCFTFSLVKHISYFTHFSASIYVYSFV